MYNLDVYSNVRGLTDKYKKLWWDTDKSFPTFSKKISLKEKLIKERKMDKFLNELFTQLAKCPEEDGDREAWRNILWSMIKNFGRASGFTEDEINSNFSRSLPSATHKFINYIKEFDRDLSLDKTGQALRNLWIMNIIQALFDIKAECTPSIFAYSMLYPYTDNYLDSTEISLEDKKSINRRFRLRLQGEKIKAENSLEENLFKLVSMIEKQYPRDGYREIYESLLSIHDAQCLSLTQQNGIISPYEKDIPGISTEKGGTSVLADAYLVKGELSEKEADFMFGYGALLQFCDDLQDAREDDRNGHMTMFSVTSEKWTLDNISNALFNYNDKVIDSDEGFTGEEACMIKAFLKKNVIYLIFEAISQNYTLYSKAYIRNIEKYYPFRMSYTRKLYKKIKNKYSEFKSTQGYSIDQVISMAADTD